MSALRIAQPHEPVRYIDLGPSRHVPTRRAVPHGSLVVPGPTSYRSEDRKAQQRVRAFRLRHGGRTAA